MPLPLIIRPCCALVIRHPSVLRPRHPSVLRPRVPQARKMKALVVSDEFWHKSEVFLAIEEVPECALRVLDGDKPNLKDVAFTYYMIEKEFGDPLLGKLAEIKNYGDFDLGITLGSEHKGSLKSYALAMLKKRSGDWLSTPVVAAAAVNPVYSYSIDEVSLWSVPGGDAAVRVVISKLLWGRAQQQADALAGWDRYSQKIGIYAIDSKMYDSNIVRHKGRSSSQLPG